MSPPIRKAAHIPTLVLAFVLVASGQDPSCQIVAGIPDQDTFLQEVKHVLKARPADASASVAVSPKPAASHGSKGTRARGREDPACVAPMRPHHGRDVGACQCARAFPQVRYHGRCGL